MNADFPFANSAESSPLDVYASMCAVDQITENPTLRRLLDCDAKRRMNLEHIKTDDELYLLDGSSARKKKKRALSIPYREDFSTNVDSVLPGDATAASTSLSSDGEQRGLAATTTTTVAVKVKSPACSPRNKNSSSSSTPLRKTSRSRNGSEDCDDALLYRTSVSPRDVTAAPHYLITIALKGNAEERRSQWQALQQDATRELIDAVKTANISLVKYLLEQLASPSNVALSKLLVCEKLPPLLDVNKFDDKNITACHHAAAKSLEILKLLVDEWQADIFAHRYHYTVWCHALSSLSKGIGGDEAVVDFLKERGADNLDMEGSGGGGARGGDSALANKYLKQYQAQFQPRNKKKGSNARKRMAEHNKMKLLGKSPRKNNKSSDDLVHKANMDATKDGFGAWKSNDMEKNKRVVG